MTPEQRAKLEAKVFGGGGPPKERAAPPKEGATNPRAAEKEVLPGTDPTDSAANAAGYAFMDKASLGFLPFLRDKMAGLVGETDQLDRFQQRARDEEHHPIASTAGAIGGTVLPMALGGAGVAAAAPRLGTAATGALASGGANLADQTARKVLDDRDISGTELALNTALGGVGPKQLLNAGHAIFSPKTFALQKAYQHGPNIMKGVTDALKSEVPEAAAAAESTLAGQASSALDDAAAAGQAYRKAQAAPKPPAGPPPTPGPGPLRPVDTPLEDLAGYAPDDPLAEIARMARKNPSGTPHFPETPPPRTPDLSNVDPGGPPGLPFQGIRPSKLEPGSPLREQLSARIRGEPPPVPPPPPAPPAPPGLLDRAVTSLPGRYGGAAGVTETGKTVTREKRQERKKRRS